MEKVAIIGLSCLFPGAQSPEQYWQNLIEQKDLTTLATAEQMGVDPSWFYAPEKGKPERYYCARGGYIRDFQFDPSGYTIEPNLLADLDPLYQWSLTAAKQALQDSGYYQNAAILEKCGVILGNLSFPTRRSHSLFAPLYQSALSSSLQELLQLPEFQLSSDSNQPHWLNGLLNGYPSALIAQALSLSSLNFCLDSACASALYSIQLACQALLTRKADLMLAGAVSAADPLFINMGFSIFQAYPENQQSRPLDRSSGGLVAGEGASIVVLKRYQDAIRDGDQIHAVIRGIGLSNDGKGKFVLSPNPKGQILAFERAYAEAGINPKAIDYVECHATGTPLGDSTEVNSIDSFFGRYQANPQIGSVKSNVGHLLTTAGMAGLIKVILSMKHGKIPPTLHVSDPIYSENGVITSQQIVTEVQPWTKQQKYAAVSAFGFGGTNAHLILESPSCKAEPEAKPPQLPKLAIVGMDAHFGAYECLESFDRAIYDATQAMIPLPPNRWKGLEKSAPSGAYIEQFELDFLRYKLPPRNDDRLIPQQLLMLKVADQAIRDAGLKPGSHVAVIVAMGTELSLHQFRGRCDLIWQIRAGLEQAGVELSEKELAELEEIAKDSFHPVAQINQYTSFIGNLLASRVSALWDFSGPAFTLSAEENSTFRALEVAQMMLSTSSLDAVVVGAIDLAGGIESVQLRLQQAPIQSNRSSLSFDQQVQGWTIGEGAGAVVLKGLEQTEKSDRIYAVIDAVSLVQGNHSSSQIPVAPDAQWVQQACEQAFAIAKIQPDAVGYLEVFGSGIVQEDQAEIEGLLKAYQSARLSCCLGSVKATVGHTYAASGMASLIKTALTLYHRYLPATPNWSKPKHLTVWEDSPFFVETASRTWFSDTSKRVAAINGLGLDRSYAHLILSEPVERRECLEHAVAGMPFYLFLLAASTENELRSQLTDLRQRLKKQSIDKTAIETFQHYQAAEKMEYCLAIVGRTQLEVLREIQFADPGIALAFEQGQEWKTPLGSYFTAQPLGQHPVAFVYPGMGSSDIGLGRDVFRLFPHLHEAFSSLTKYPSEVIQEKFLYPRNLEKASEKVQTEHLAKFLSDGVALCQSGISLAVLYTLILRETFAIQPDAAFGYSLGEASSMLFALGVWRDDQNLSEVLSTSPLFKTELCGDCTAGREAWNIPDDQAFWCSYVLKGSVAKVQAEIASNSKVYLTFINTPNECVIAGDPQACLALIEQIQCQAFPVPFQSILHSEIARSRYAELVQLHTMSVKPVPGIQFYSGVQCAPIQLNSSILAQNSAQLCCQTVDFPALIQRVTQDGVRIFIELGAGNHCTQRIGETLKDIPHLAVSMSGRGVDDFTALVRGFAKLVSHRVSLDLSPLYALATQTTPNAKQLLQTIVLGGTPIQKTILTSENKARFSNQIPAHPTVKHSLIQFKTLPMMKPSELSSHEQMLKILQLQITNSQKAQNEQPSTQCVTLEAPSGVAAIWDEADLLEFAEGRIASVFGEEYREIDTYTRRVRLPMPPYLLVSRITKLDATRGVYQPCSITTEYDIPKKAWYSVDGQVPSAIAVESGQCDLLLISYLGIDFENKGDRIYRLLDCTLTFLDDFPKEGETLRYDIKIQSFVRSGDNLLFFFSYECFVDDRMILKMENGCAGFFSDEQLENSKGVIFSEKELQARNEVQKQRFDPLLICQKTKFNDADLSRLMEGNLAACFGNHYDQRGLNPSLRLPSRDMLMLDRIVSVDSTGGAWGLGIVTAEKTIHPDDWYFPCHFKDDPVMAGSLMAEGCSQLLQFYLLYLGLQTCTVDARFQPIPGVRQVVRCRGQVTPTQATLTYRLEVSEIGVAPNPYAKCQVEIILDGKVIVHFKDLGLQLSEKNQQARLNPSVEAPRSLSLPLKPALLNETQVEAFCTGAIADCFGAEYAVYDNGGVKASRMPNTHLNLVHRVIEVQGQRHQLTKGSEIVTEYDVPENPWYYRQNSCPTLPYSILMELGLQPCGFLSAYLGTTLMYPTEDLYFRNLDGKGHLQKQSDVRGKTITNRSRLLSSANIQGVIIQSFDFQLSCENEIFYQGESTFGHFSPKALASQIGLDRGQFLQPWIATNHSALPEIKIDLRQPDTASQFYRSPQNQPFHRLAHHQLDLLHEVQIVPNGGKHEQGYLYARKQILPSDWYFKCHFYQDPVMPGSLGVEAMLQAMQVYAMVLNLGNAFQSPCFVPVADHTTVWKYRGQIPHELTELSLEIHITKVEKHSDQILLFGDASLWKPNLRIYEVKNIALCITESTCL